MTNPVALLLPLTQAPPACMTHRELVVGNSFQGLAKPQQFIKGDSRLDFAGRS